MLKPLIIASSFLEEKSANGQVERRFFPSLVPMGYNPHILCYTIGKMSFSPEGCKIIKVPFSKFIYFWTRSLRHSPWPYVLNTPDQFYYCWGRQAIKKALSLCDVEHYDYIHTISMPSSDHLIGLKLKQKTGIPWIAHFYDPWIGNPFREINNRTYKKLDAAYERLVAEYADIIIHPCQTAADSWIERYGNLVKDKIRILPFLGDIFDVSENSSSQKECITISHIGNLSNNRNTQTFIKAVDILITKHPEYRTRLKVNYIGTVTSSEKQMVDAKGLSEMFNFVGRKTEQECIEYYKSSDIFLIVDINCTPNLFYPSKIIKYFAWKKPILGITTEQSTIRDELNKTGNHSFNYQDAEGVASFLVSAIENYPSVCTNDCNYWKRFAKESVLSEYDRLISPFIGK